MVFPSTNMSTKKEVLELQRRSYQKAREELISYLCSLAESAKHDGKRFPLMWTNENSLLHLGRASQAALGERESFLAFALRVAKRFWNGSEGKDG